MALFGVFIPPILFLSFGLALSSSKKCFPFSIEQCQFNNKNTNNCYFHDKVIECITNLMGDCNDQDRMFATQQIKIIRNIKEQCPELHDGDCFSSESASCLSEVFFHLYRGINDEHCAVIKSKGKEAQDCLNRLEMVCSKDPAKNKIQIFFRDIEQMRYDCHFQEELDKKT